MHKRYLSVERLEAVARAALYGGYGHLMTTSESDVRAPAQWRRVVVLDIKHDCEAPYMYELHARWSAHHGRKVKPLMVRGTARCRKCEKCKMYRAWQWKERATVEFRSHKATIFGTFTMSPEQHYLLDARIASNTGERPARDIRALSAKELFAARVQAFGDELTKYVKIIRNGRGAKPHLRYLLVAETHDGSRTAPEMRGRPHFHIVLHTNTPELLVNEDEWFLTKPNDKGVVRKLLRDTAWLRTQWTFGFTTMEFARDERAVAYVCKYISKAMDARVRASQAYGLQSVETDQGEFMNPVSVPTGTPSTSRG